jgi:hypothetical protein
VLKGSIRVNGKWVTRSSLAGAYPPQLCREWASAATDAFVKVQQRRIAGARVGCAPGQTRRSEVYVRQLDLALAALARFAEARGGESVTEAASSATSANRLLVNFVQAEFDAGAKIHVAKHAVLGLQYYFRELKGKVARRVGCN